MEIPGPVNNGTITSPTNGVLGTAGLFALGQHDTCGAGTACEVFASEQTESLA